MLYARIRGPREKRPAPNDTSVNLVCIIFAVNCILPSRFERINKNGQDFNILFILSILVRTTPPALISVNGVSCPPETNSSVHSSSNKKIPESRYRPSGTEVSNPRYHPDSPGSHGSGARFVYARLRGLPARLSESAIQTVHPRGSEASSETLPAVSQQPTALSRGADFLLLLVIAFILRF